MRNFDNCITCLDCRINNLENELNCVITLLNTIGSNTLNVGYNTPIDTLGNENSLYIQLKGGIFYKKNNNKWNVVGILEPLIVDGGDKALKGGN
ncbi:MAG: hypothetical protein RSE41_09110 [Clostridia bacterium]